MRAAPVRPTRKRIYYGESSSDDTLEESDEESGERRRHQPNRHAKKRQHLSATEEEVGSNHRTLRTRRQQGGSFDLSESDDNFVDSLNKDSPSHLQKRQNVKTSGFERETQSPHRYSSIRVRPAVSYKEVTSDDEDDYEDDDDAAVQVSENGYAQRRSPKARPEVSVVIQSRPLHHKKQPKAAGMTKRKVHVNKESQGKQNTTYKSDPIETDGVVPPWSTLPYEILVQTFYFASAPLRNENFIPNPSIGWLLGAARTCRAFAEPALTVLYNCPPLLARDKPYKLMELISRPAESLSFNYNVKVKRLEFNVSDTLAYNAQGRGAFDIGSLISWLPHVSEIEIMNSRDRPQFRRLETVVRWHYPDKLFSSVVSSKLRLNTWRWTASFQPRNHPKTWLRDIHLLSPFQALKVVSFINYDDQSRGTSEAAQGEESYEESLAEAISVLKNLRSLTFESSSVVSDRLLPLLPDYLHHLSLLNCRNVTSDSLGAFLISHGHHLRTLLLNHNQSLDIRFLPSLKYSCPHLEILRMDLNYFNTYATHRDSHPLYDCLLTSDEIPCWPSSLQTIELVHLRKWSSDAAEMFFTSLLNSANELPNLRSLVLKVILDIGWRDRAGFRDQWIGRLQRVFLRKSSEPAPHLSSLKAFRKWKASRHDQQLAVKLGQPSVAQNAMCEPRVNSNNGARSAQLFDSSKSRVEADRDVGKSFDTSDSDAPLFTQRQLRRAAKEAPSRPARSSQPSRQLRPRKKSPLGINSSLEMKGESASHPEREQVEEVFVQGMCAVVDIRIDNLRPTEAQFNEADFLDSEASDDEEWNSSNEAADDERHAW